ncbi:hypothetical protein OHU34_44380 (plasmid) [Streptomyces sp. NBC_00080]|uniref:hypothetical protein n=1 Tax=Streptomyces sp. NBC_00080 TaxID=2975645 RepID=UPI002F917680
MLYMAMVATALLLVLAASISVLLRRERRRMGSSPEARRIEAAATQGIRDARRQAHARRHFNGTGTIGGLRDRDSR